MLPDQSEMIHHMPLLQAFASKCRTIVELGCGHGNGSTRAFMRGLSLSPPSGVLISVDIDPDKTTDRPHPVGGVRWVQVVGDTREENTFIEVEEYIRHIGRSSIDLLFIDTDHTYEQMKRELELWSPLCTRDTIGLFHDTWMSGSYNPMTDAIKEFAAEYDMLYVDITKESHGLGMLIEKFTTPTGEANG